MPKIFISYRRSDSEADTWRLFEHLSKVFQEFEIFFDHHSIELGQDFSTAIDSALEEVNVMLVVINKTWLSTHDADGVRRIDQPHDYVYREIKRALERGITLIPLLIEGAEIPKEEELPEPLKRFSKRQGIWINHKKFAEDIMRLAKTIQKYVPASATTTHRDFSQEILAEYNEKSTLTMTGPGYNLILQYASETAESTLCGSHRLTEAVELLIEESGVNWWIKHDDELDPQEFWLRILKSVATSCRMEYDGDDEEELSDADIIRWFLPDLENINSLWLKSDAYKISQRVADAFPDVPPPSVDKMMADDWDENPEVTAAFHNRRWTSITPDQAEKFLYDFMKFGSKTAKLYLPAFLIAALKKHGEVAQTVFETLSPTKKLIPSKRKWLTDLVKQLNYHQINTVNQFIEWCEKEDLLSMDDEDRQTIKYWKQLAAK